MRSLAGRIALVTGASSGIGRSSARAFAREGARLIVAARRGERLRELARELAALPGGPPLVIELDVRDQAAVDESLHGLPAEWSEIDILLNNAGLSRGLAPLHECELADWEEMIDTNVKGLLYVTRAVVKGMVRRNRGHVINIGSIAGREVYPGGNVYCATKFAVHALTQGLRLDLNGTAIRVTTVDPGMVETEFSLVRFHGDGARAEKVYQGLQPLTPDDVADAILYAVTRPAHMNVAELVLLPTCQAGATFVSRRSG